ncbi:MAG: nicotinate-nucleotide adenylyltransferase [Pseudomonadota bacterium]
MSDTLAVLGGSFDPVHKGHVALAARFTALLEPASLRIIPAGCPWQKGGLQASAQQRIAMLELAFGAAGLPCQVDRQEVERGAPTYSIDTLRALRAELGTDASIVFLIGADQLQHLDSWRHWQDLFELAHFGVAARPGFALDALPPAVAMEVQRRQGSLAQLKNTPSGHLYLAGDLAVDVSATAIRAALQRGEAANSLIPPVVLDYIQQHNLYKN